MRQIHVDTGKNAIHVIDKGLVHRLYEMHFQIYNKMSSGNVGKRHILLKERTPNPQILWTDYQLH